ncbi:MAG: hypothetical protein HY741_12055 [Chloroflexi bacterium]|nr:hypothetical protein [Chloroflexota bacterium]
MFATLLAACVAPSSSPPPTATPTPGILAATPTISGNSIPVIEIITASTVETHPGERATIRLRFQPMRSEIGKTASGATYVSRTPWENANVTQMRVCMQIETACEPTGAWTDYQAEWNVSLDTDWLDERSVWIGTQFRDANGKRIPVFDHSQVNAQESGTTQVSMYSTLDERTPLAAQPAFAQTAVAATRVAFPVTGSLVLQDGLCCAGGKVGATIEIHAAFEASSPNTTVTHMRLLNRCATPIEMNIAPWEPFAKQKTWRVGVSVPNWVGWYLAVQYRDANGKLSPVYCDDISVEGMP